MMESSKVIIDLPKFGDYPHLRIKSEEPKYR